jgi:hypothetical protein
MLPIFNILAQSDEPLKPDPKKFMSFLREILLFHFISFQYKMKKSGKAAPPIKY